VVSETAATSATVPGIRGRVVVGGSATLPLAMQSAAMGQLRRLNCQPAGYIPALPRITHGRLRVDVTH